MIKENNSSFENNSNVEKQNILYTPQNLQFQNEYKNSDDEASGDEGDSKSRIHIPKFDMNDNYYEFYEYLRNEFKNSGQPWEDPEFPNDPKLFGRNGEIPER